MSLRDRLNDFEDFAAKTAKFGESTVSVAKDIFGTTVEGGSSLSSLLTQSPTLSNDSDKAEDEANILQILKSKASAFLSGAADFDISEVTSEIASSAGEKFEAILQNIPGYEMVKSIIDGTMNESNDAQSALTTALAAYPSDIIDEAFGIVGGDDVFDS